MRRQLPDFLEDTLWRWHLAERLSGCISFLDIVLTPGFCRS